MAKKKEVKRLNMVVEVLLVVGFWCLELLVIGDWFLVLLVKHLDGQEEEGEEVEYCGGSLFNCWLLVLCSLGDLFLVLMANAK